MPEGTESPYSQLAAIHRRLIEKDRRYVIGIAGTYCSGKSTIAQWILDQAQILSPGEEILPLDPLHIEVDQLGHQALILESARVKAVMQPFLTQSGEMELVNSDGSINRKVLGRVVFSNPEALSALESVTHPRMCLLTDQLLAERERGLVVLNAAILFKMGLQTRCDTVVWVDAPVILRFFRALRRDHLGIIKTWQRIRTQRRMKSQLPLKNADIICVSNWGGTKGLRTAGRILVEKLWNRIEAL